MNFIFKHRYCYNYYEIDRSVTLDYRDESVIEDLSSDSKMADPMIGILPCSDSWGHTLRASHWRGQGVFYQTRRHLSKQAIEDMTYFKSNQERIQKSQAMKLILARNRDAKWLKKIDALKKRIKVSARSSDKIIRQLEIEGY